MFMYVYATYMYSSTNTYIPLFQMCKFEIPAKDIYFAKSDKLLALPRLA